MNEINDLIEKTINPPGILKKNRRALFLTIRDIAELVRKDALTAFNAHFPYLADSKKLREHGDALLIPHLLHDSETEYRERVAAASFFLMKAGERQYIIGQLEERFTTRYKIIEEFLNVHLKVTDLTDEEREWALELMDSLLNPNIYTELAEWFHYIDDVMLSENGMYTYDRQDIDFFEEKILRDGRILRDDKTIFDKTVKVLRDGCFKRNGRYGRSGEYTFPGTNIMRLPLTRGSGYRDILIPTLKKPLADIQLGAPPRDGTRPRDGVFPRGWHTAFETIPPFDLFNVEIETLPSSCLYHAVVKKPMRDTHVNSIIRDGSRLRNGMLQRADILDESALSYTKYEADTARYKIWRDGALKRDGSENRSGMGRESMNEREGAAYTVTPLAETITAGESFQGLITSDSTEEYINSVTRNGTYKRDGLLQRANLLDTAGMNYKTSAVKEAAQYRMFRNGMARRDGRDSRSGFGGSGMYEKGVETIKVLVEKENEEVRDDAFQMAYKNNSGDFFKNTRKRDGVFPRDGATRRSNYILDTAGMNYKTSAVKETAQYRIFRNGMARRDGTESRSGFGGSGMYEKGVETIKVPGEKEIEEVRDDAFQMAYKNNSGDIFKNTRKRDGIFPRDGATRRSSYIIDVYAFKYTTSTFQEDAAMDEGFTAGMRKHHYRDGGYLRDGSIVRDSMMLLPL